MDYKLIQITIKVKITFENLLKRLFLLLNNISFYLH